MLQKPSSDFVIRHFVFFVLSLTSLIASSLSVQGLRIGFSLQSLFTALFRKLVNSLRRILKGVHVLGEDSLFLS